MPSRTRASFVTTIADHLAKVADAPVVQAAALLTEAWEQATQQFGGLALDPPVYARHVLERLPEGLDVVTALSRLQLHDLFLAAACMQALPASAGALDQILSAITPAVQQLGFSETVLQDALQETRRNMLVGGNNERPAIVQYSGRGPLSSWLKVTVIRAALRLTRREQRQHTASSDPAGQLAATTISPELQYLKRIYHDAFQRAFNEALQSLSARQRTLLLQRYVDGLRTREIGELHQVNQATASRWLSRAHADLHAATREALMQRLEVETPEIESILRLVRSELEITLRQLLRE